MPKALEVKPLKQYRIWIRYSDGVEGEVDLSSLVGKGLLSLLKDEKAFTRVHIGSGGEIAFTEEIALCPDAIYLKLTGKSPEELFPRLRELAPVDA